VAASEGRCNPVLIEFQRTVKGTPFIVGFDGIADEDSPLFVDLRVVPRTGLVKGGFCKRNTDTQML
jgi:hypothetical protein